MSRFDINIFLVANSTQQAQNYLNNIDFKKTTAFIIDDYKIVSDQNSRSPLLGLYSAFKELKKLGYKKAFVLSCDSPLIKYEVIDFLIEQCNEFDCCIPKWENDFLEPLFAIYTVDKAYETSLRNITQNKYKLTRIISHDWKTKYISIEQEIKAIDPNLLSFKNINIPEDIKILEVILNKIQ